MAGAGVSGVGGTATSDTNPIAEITGWRFTETSNNPAYASSGTGGYKYRVAGVKDGSGSVDFKYVNAAQQALIVVGSKVDLVLLRSTGGDSITVPNAIIDSINHEVDVNEGEVVSGSFDFSSTEAWS